MDTAAPPLLAQILRSRRDVIANDWYRAIAPTAFVPLDVTQVRQRLADLTEQIITLVLTDPLDRDAARSIGVALAHLHYVQPEALAATQEAVTHQFIEGLSTDQIVTLYPRLTALLAELTAGFLAKARETILAEQEHSRLALVAAHQQAQEALQKSEQRFHTLIEKGQETISIIGSDGTIRYESPSAEQILGYKPEEMVGKYALDFIRPDEVQALREVYAEVLNHPGLARPGNCTFRRKDGSWRTMEFTVASFFNDPAINGLVVNSRDITSRKQVEERLDRLSKAIEASSEAICMTDLAGTQIYQNQAFSDLFEYSVDELNAAGGVAMAFCKSNAARQVFDTAVGGHSWSGEVEMCTRSGRTVSISLRADGVMDQSGRVMTLICIMTDITERRQMEELLMRHAQEMEALYKTSLEINSQLDVPKLLEAIVQRAARLVGTRMGALYLMRSDSHAVELVVSHNLPGDDRGVTLRLGEGLAGRVAQTGKPMAIDDYLHWEGRAAGYANASFRRVLGVPLQVRNKVIGVITINDGITTGPFDEDEIRLVGQFADQAAIAIENARLYQAEQEQRELAETLREVGAMLVSTLDTHIVLERILEQVSRVTPNDAANIMLIKGDRAHFAGWRGYEQFGIKDLTNFTFSVAGTHNLQHMVETGEPVVIQDVHADPHWIHAPGMERLRSYAGVPIRVRGETIGFLAVNSIIPDHFERTDAEKLRAFADQAAIAWENARLFEDTRRTAERLQALSHRMVEVQEAERRFIARELHDEIGQTLTAVKINLQALQRSSDAFRHAAILEENVTVIERALQQVRNLSLDLRPSLLDDLGLVPALRWYVNRQAERAGFTAAFTADSIEAHLSPDLEIACFRVAQEALTNAVRHARAQHVVVELLQRDAEVELTIRDDGVGFDVQSALECAMHGASLGLLGMDERVSLVGGHMEIESVPMRGTEIRARFPLASPSSRAQVPPVG